MFFLDYSKHWITSLVDNSEWGKAASNSSVRKLKVIGAAFPAPERMLYM